MKTKRTFKRKELTPEQISARDEKRARLVEMNRRIAAMTDLERGEIVSRCGAVVTCEGHALSPRNTILCAMQLPAVSVVGGFRQWLAVGRCVAKGAKAAAILVPCVARGKGGESGEGAEIVLSEGEAESGGGIRFVSRNVFDISQTVALGENQEESAAVSAA